MVYTSIILRQDSALWSSLSFTLFRFFQIRWNPQLTTRRLVLDTLKPLPGDRKCFRMINGVLTERTVKEVIPMLETNTTGLKQALDALVEQYKTKQEEMEKWKVRLTP